MSRLGHGSPIECKLVLFSSHEEEGLPLWLLRVQNNIVRISVNTTIGIKILLDLPR
jgi:hypothetical protein